EVVADVLHPAAGVVDQHIEASELGNGGVNNALAILWLGHIGCECENAGIVEFTRDLIDLRLLAGGRYDNLASRACQPAGHRATKSSSTACHDGHPAFRRSRRSRYVQLRSLSLRHLPETNSDAAR